MYTNVSYVQALSSTLPVKSRLMLREGAPVALGDITY